MRFQVLDIDPRSYQPHRLHGADRIWAESNCAADLWIEVLHALGLEPMAAMGFTLSSGFDGEQWRMFKFLPADLQRLYGIDAYEVNLWRDVADHAVEQVALGRLLTIDVDAWWLPDTASLTYRTGHQKTTVAVQMIDTDRRTLGYFHNGGYYELGGEDFDALTGGGPASPSALPPYAEAIDVSGLRHDDNDDVKRAAMELAADHLGRRPPGNPVRQMRKRLEDDFSWLAEAGLETFHRYAFGSIRQCGANAELAADYVRWLDPEFAPVAEAFVDVAHGAKALEFVLARQLRRGRLDLDDVMSPMESRWEHAIETLASSFDV